MINLKLGKSKEDYLKAVLILQKRMSIVRSVDLVQYMGYSKASISHAVGELRRRGLLKVDENLHLHLIEMGNKVANKINERHRVLTDILVDIGVSPEQADHDACEIEHVVSDESFQKLCEFLKIKQGR